MKLGTALTDNCLLKIMNSLINLLHKFNNIKMGLKVLKQGAAMKVQIITYNNNGLQKMIILKKHCHQT